MVGRKGGKGCESESADGWRREGEERDSKEGRNVGNKDDVEKWYQRGLGY